MQLAIFDLDNTLLAGDSDYQWGQFVASKGVIDQAKYEQRNAEFYQDYKDGVLDINAFLEFAFEPLTRVSLPELQQWHAEFMQTHIEPIMLPKAKALIEQHRQQGHTLLVLTATNLFITGPIAAAFNIEHIVATEPELKDGRYTGKVHGTPCFQEGKITRLQQWLDEQGLVATETWFYSDSINDLPLLEQVDYPVVVDPDDKLSTTAEQRNWPVVSLRDAQTLGKER